MKKYCYGLILTILTSGCTIHTQANTGPAPTDFGPVVKYDISQCPAIAAGKYSRSGESDQVAISLSGTALKVRDRGVDFNIDGRQYTLADGNSYVGTCFQKTIRIMLNQIDGKSSNTVIMYAPSRASKSGLDRAVFDGRKDGKPSDVATYIPVVET